MDKPVIFFDYDGVLVNTFFDALSIAQNLDKNLTKQEFRRWFRTNPIKAIMSKEEEGNKFIKEFFKKYKEKIKNKKINPKLKSCIKNLYEDYLLTIISSSSTNSIKEQLKQDELDSFFYEIKGYDDHPSKAKKIKEVLTVYKQEPANSLLITDTLGDIKEARSVNVNSIAVTWGFQKEETIQKGNPYKIIDKPNKLESSIRNYFNENEG